MNPPQRPHGPQDEVCSIRLSYEEQIGVLSNHLAELNAKLAATSKKK